ncbi:hypothetical protein [Acinetobacter venetianus]|uniref:Uncharacterized protein n=1 Tax=Acinetobacter venetianus TaxID=52133 RepID=A0A150HUJ1_9GAMM|nr:hypothetical protein [Acinetobacter venetianus]KXZ70374.1 hypothetical protein AVENLUH13518_01858 [Acinetobacter venetianus]
MTKDIELELSAHNLDCTIDALKAEFSEIIKENEVERLIELSMKLGELYAQLDFNKKLEGCVVVPDTHMLIEKKDIENWYLDESEYMWFEADGIDGYLEDIDIGEVIEVQRKEYVVTNNNPVFAAKPWDDNGNCADTWEFFESKDEAEKAAAHCKAMVEAARGGNE